MVGQPLAVCEVKGFSRGAGMQLTAQLQKVTTSPNFCSAARTCLLSPSEFRGGDTVMCICEARRARRALVFVIAMLCRCGDLAMGVAERKMSIVAVRSWHQSTSTAHSIAGLTRTP